MFNPLLQDLTTLKDADLDNKINELSKKYHTAARFGQGGMCTQIAVILEAMRDEQRQRQANMLKKSIATGDKDLGDLIKVN